MVQSITKLNNKSGDKSMEFTPTRTVHTTAYLLLALVVTQAIFTGIYASGSQPPTQLLWGLEGVLFTILAAFAGAALVQAKNYHVGWSAIAFSAALNVVQVGIGLTLFGPFGEAAKETGALAPVAGGIVAFSFMVYNAAKILLGFAALIFGMAKMNAGGKALGGLTAAVGVIAMVANIALIILGREGLVPPPAAGASGVVATLLLALCLLSVVKDHEQQA